jgi:hypothetical protein
MDPKEYIHDNITNTGVLKLADKFYSKLNTTDIDYYASFDNNLSQEYNKTVNSYAMLFLNINKYVS